MLPRRPRALGLLVAACIGLAGCNDDGRTLETPRYDRTKLFAGEVVEGPAILIQHNATTLVPPGYGAETLAHGNMRIRALGAT